MNNNERFKPTDCIVILSDGVVTKAYHKRGGKIVSQSETKKHPIDDHNLWYAIDICTDRMHNTEKLHSYYNGKVVCLNTYHKYNGDVWTKGKIYQVKNGVIEDNFSRQLTNIKSFQELCERCAYATHWLEIKE